jgi:ribulose-5-phosphate 4-epimerase/fuculose-1-phosphate aldolase
MATVRASDRINSADLALRREVAACTRLLTEAGIIDYSGHVAARLPEGDAILIQPIDTPRHEVEPDELFVVGLDGKVRSGPAGDRPPSETAIHTEIMRARPDINAVAHIHAEIATLFTLVEGVPLVPVKNHAARWADGIPEHPDPSHIDTAERGRALAATLGRRNAALIRAHGAVVTSEGVQTLFADCLHFVTNAEALYRARQLGPVRPLTPEECRAFLERFGRERQARKIWRTYVGRAVASGIVPAEWFNEQR